MLAESGLELAILLPQLPTSVVGVICRCHSTLQRCNFKLKCLNDSLGVIENVCLSKNLKEVKVIILGI